MSKSENNYAFIDSQNLYRGVQASGWQVDYRKLRLYLKNKYSVQRAYLFIGYLEGNEGLYQMLQEMGYILIFKPTMVIRKNGNETVKGNVDAELVLHASAITYNDYDKAIIISNDGDFYCLVKFLDERDKLLKLLAPSKHYSGLLRKYDGYIVRIDKLRKSLELKKTKTSGRSKP